MNAKELRAWMEARGWSTKDLASRLPCNPRTVQRYLSGKLAIRDAIARSITALPVNAPVIDKKGATK